MNNNRFHSLIIQALLNQTEVLKIEFCGDNLPTANLKITIKTGSGSVTLTYNYHGEAIELSNVGRIKSSYMLKITAIMQEVEDLIRA